MSAKGVPLAGMLVAGVAVLSPSARAGDACVMVNGFDANGFDANGFDHNGFDVNGLDANGFNSSGFDGNGYDRNGVLFQCGYPSEAARLADPLNDLAANPPRYDISCLDRNGYDIKGYDSRGIDRNGWYRPDLRPVAGQDPSQQPLPTESCVPLQKADGTVVSNPACARRNTIFEPDACALANAVVTWPPSSTFYGSTAPPAVIGWDVDVANLPAGAYRCPWNGEFTGSGFNSQGFDVSGYGRDGFNHVNFSRTAGHRPRLNPPCDPGPTVTFLTAPATIAAGLSGRPR